MDVPKEAVGQGSILAVHVGQFFKRVREISVGIQPVFFGRFHNAVDGSAGMGGVTSSNHLRNTSTTGRLRRPRAFKRSSGEKLANPRLIANN